MKIKKVLMLGAAVLVCGVSSAANASDRLFTYEVDTFITKLTNAINNPDPDVGHSFLERNVNDGAVFANTYSTPVAYNSYYGRVVDQNPYISPYYRYPYNYDYMRPTSYGTTNKDDMINQLEHKKGFIPRYHQSIQILGSNMSPDGSSVTLDVRLKEYGRSYVMGSDGLQYQGYEFEHADSRCMLSLGVKWEDIQITGMNCNTYLRTPI